LNTEPSFLSELIKNQELGLSSIFLSIAGLMFFYLRRDADQYRKEYKEIIQNMFKIVEKNTEANARLSETIQDLKNKIN